MSWREKEPFSLSHPKEREKRNDTGGVRPRTIGRAVEERRTRRDALKLQAAPHEEDQCTQCVKGARERSRPDAHRHQDDLSTREERDAGRRYEME